MTRGRMMFRAGRVDRPFFLSDLPVTLNCRRILSVTGGNDVKQQCSQFCDQCERWFVSKRRDAVTCGPRCRKRLQRALRKAKQSGRAGKGG